MILKNQRGKHTDAEMATSTNIPKAASCQFGHKRCRKGRCSTHVTIVPSNSHRGQTSLIDDNTLLINTEETSESFQASALAAAISGLSRYKTKTYFSSLVQSSSLVLQNRRASDSVAPGSTGEHRGAQQLRSLDSAASPTAPAFFTLTLALFSGHTEGKEGTSLPCLISL